MSDQDISEELTLAASQRDTITITWKKRVRVLYYSLQIDGAGTIGVEKDTLVNYFNKASQGLIDLGSGQITRRSSTQVTFSTSYGKNFAQLGVLKVVDKIELGLFNTTTDAINFSLEVAVDTRDAWVHDKRVSM